MRVREVREGFLEEVVQAYLTGIVDRFQTIPIKGIVIFLLLEVLAFNL